ncbi:lipocalin-like domain-containing protein [Tamlana sp. I1]|uniref:lipocalin-like domain-containing protein n=1 Tax=Tamlana sp. I1 TaxID=2762061 RepID=UPI00188ED0B2|nr:glycoside hydrolase family 43 C-terminal domain-containing protein [Tamlana sp. I1]
MKHILFLACILISVSAYSQTEKELIGKWHLIGFTTPEGNKKSIQEEFGTTEVYQIFYKDHVFVSTIGDEEYSGTWELKDNNKELEIETDDGPLRFHVVYADKKKRTISNGMLGTLEYVRAANE